MPKESLDSAERLEHTLRMIEGSPDDRTATCLLAILNDDAIDPFRSENKFGAANDQNFVNQLSCQVMDKKLIGYVFGAGSTAVGPKGVGSEFQLGPNGEVTGEGGNQATKDIMNGTAPGLKRGAAAFGIRHFGSLVPYRKEDFCAKS